MDDPKVAVLPSSNSLHIEPKESLIISDLVQSYSNVIQAFLSRFGVMKLCMHRLLL